MGRVPKKSLDIAGQFRKEGQVTQTEIRHM